ncbi:hypothetical protein GCM10027361_05580 [Erwinia aphidicola]
MIPPPINSTSVFCGAGVSACSAVDTSRADRESRGIVFLNLDIAVRDIYIGFKIEAIF